MRKKVTCSIVGMILAAHATLLLAQQHVVFKGQELAVIEAPATRDGVEPAGPAKICIVRSANCFTARYNRPQFGFSPKAAVVEISSKEQAILFSAVASASGSGTLTMLALLDLHDGEWEDFLPPVAITNQGEYKIWRESRISDMALFVTARHC